MFTKLFSSDTFTDPGRLDAALRAVTTPWRWTTAWATRDLLSLAYSLRNVDPSDVEYFTAPGARHGHGGRRQRRLPRPE